MDKKIPELKGKGKNTLYIIGNGFDLYHGLRTSYHDFLDWLISHHCNDFVSDMEKMFPKLSGNKPLLWQDFEEALDSFNLLDIHKHFFQGKDDGFYDEGTYNRVVNRIRTTLNDIPVFLRQWIEDIDVGKAQNRLNMNSDSLYLSFNYTLLLEYNYYIPKGNILHVHNSLDDKASLITGHKTPVSEYEAEKRCWGSNEEKSTQLIAQELNKLVKPVGQQIEQHQDFFKSLKDISNIVVFGHSLSVVDRRYFAEILRNIQANSHWYFIGKENKSMAIFEDYVKRFNNKKYYQAGCGCITEDPAYKKKMSTEKCKNIDTEKLH